MSLALLGRRRIPIAAQSLTWGGFRSQGVWVSLLVSNRARYFRVTALSVPQFHCCKGGGLQVVGMGEVAAMDL